MTHTQRHTIWFSLLLVLSLLLHNVWAEDLEFGPPLIVNGDLSAPGGLAINAATNRVFVADTGNHRVRYFDLPLTGSSPAWQEFGYVADRSADEALAAPQGIAIDSNRHAYVVDTFHNEVKLYRYRPASDDYQLDIRFTADTRRTVAGVNIDLPRDIAVGPGDQVYLLDSGNKRILVANGPGARRWTVWHANPAWRNPYGLDVSADGVVYLADTDNHRIIRINPDRSETVFGRYGTSSDELRYPRDVSVAADGRMVIADTHNHRILLWHADGRYYRQLRPGRLFGGLDKIEMNAENHVFSLDRTLKRVILYLGPSATRPYDGYIRDYAGDTGEEPSAPDVRLQSPDILFRYAPDVDLSLAAREGLEHYGSDTPIYGQDIYTYFRWHNRGMFDLPGGMMRLYTLSATGPYDFPADWSARNIFQPGTDAVADREDNTLVIPIIPAQDSSSGSPINGSRIVGPLIWRVPARSGTTCEGEEKLAVRLINVNDPSADAAGLDVIRLNNNSAGLQVSVVTADCIPDPDRYEENDSPLTGGEVTERWTHLHRRCPRVITQRTGESYPDAICEGVFNNFARPGDARSAEEIWTLVIPNLSLHSRSDRDFFDIQLPDPGVAEYGNDDIRSPENRLRNPVDRQPMPECGAVQRQDFGPSGLDNTIYVNIGTQLKVTIEPTDGSNNTLTSRTLNISGETLHLYRDAERVDELWSGAPIRKTIDCPRSLHSMPTMRISFGERERERETLRELAATGGYQIRLQYITSIERGIPSWVGELGPDRPRPGLFCGPRIIRGIPGIGGAFPGGFAPNFFFPNCLPGLDNFFRGDFLHPQTPLRPDCLADGPDCWEDFLVHWRDRAALDMLVHSPLPINLQILDENKKVIGQSKPISSQPLPQSMTHAQTPNQQAGIAQRLYIPDLQPGYYVLRISGKPTTYELEFNQKSIGNFTPNNVNQFHNKLPDSLQ